jgi:hypothetical protein
MESEKMEIEFDEMVEKLEYYMKSAGKNDGLSTFEDGIYTVNDEEELENTLKEMNEEMMDDWSYNGFDFFSEMENLKKEIGQKVDNDKFHEIVASAFEKYYVDAFLKEFKLLTMEKLSESD